MYPDGLMAVQSTSVSTAGSWLRQLRIGILATAGAAVGIGLVANQAMTNVPQRSFGFAPACTAASGFYNAESAIVELCREGRAQEAVEVADRAIAARDLPATHAELCALRGGAFRVMRGREEDASASYGEAVTCRVGLEILRFSEDASASYGKAVTLTSPDTSSDSFMDLCAQAGQTKRADEIARQALEMNASPVAVNNACWELTMYGDGDPAAAADAMARVVEEHPSAMFLDTYAWTLYRSGHTQQAIDMEERALAAVRGEGLDQIDYYTACVAGMKGDTRRAEKALRRVYQDDITFTSAWVAANRFADSG